MKELKDIEKLTRLGRKYREDANYRDAYLSKIKEKKFCNICDKFVCSVNFARHCRGKKHLAICGELKAKDTSNAQSTTKITKV